LRSFGHLARQRRAEQARGVQRLQQIVAGRGQKARLVTVRPRQQRVGFRQFARAFGHARFQPRQRALQLGAHARFSVMSI
jgi:hypothetical protein